MKSAIRKWLLLACLGTSGCDQQMADQPRYDPFEASRFFADGSSARVPVAGTVPRGALIDDPQFVTGLIEEPDVSEGWLPPSLVDMDRYTNSNPLGVTLKVMQRGRDRYGIYCAVCHGDDGEGAGILTESGFPRGESLQGERLRGAPEGYLFQVITHGYGRMPGLSGQTPVADRWAIIAYVRALQLSRNAPLEEHSIPIEQAMQQLAEQADNRGVQNRRATIATDAGSGRFVNSPSHSEYE